jgi:large subunit ribosomal protein L21
MSEQLAIIEASGRQFKVAVGTRLTVNRVTGKLGDKIALNPVALFSDDGEMTRLTPAEIKDAQVTAKIVAHNRGEKLIAFKRRRRKGWKTKKGHRQEQTILEVATIK